MGVRDRAGDEREVGIGDVPAHRAGQLVHAAQVRHERAVGVHLPGDGHHAADGRVGLAVAQQLRCREQLPLGLAERAAGEHEGVGIAQVVLGLLERPQAGVADTLAEQRAELAVVAVPAEGIGSSEDRCRCPRDRLVVDLAHRPGRRIEAPQVRLGQRLLAGQPLVATDGVVLLDVRGGGIAARPRRGIGRVERVDVERDGCDAEAVVEALGEVPGRLAGLAAARDEVLVTLAGQVGGVRRAVPQRAHRHDMVEAAAVLDRDVARGAPGTCPRAARRAHGRGPCRPGRQRPRACSRRSGRRP